MTWGLATLSNNREHRADGSADMVLIVGDDAFLRLTTVVVRLLKHN